jgi:hypothetical protein
MMRRCWCGRPVFVRLVQAFDGFAQGANGQQPQSRHDRGFGEVVVRQQQRAGAVAPRFRGDWQHAARRLDRSIERQLANVDETGEIVARHDSGGLQNAHRDRQIECRAGFAHIARCEVDGDARDGEVVTAIAHCRPDTIAAFADAGIRQPDQLKCREAAADVDLDVHAAGVDADDRGAFDGCKHARERCNRMTCSGSGDNRPLLQVIRRSWGCPAAESSMRILWRYGKNGHHKFFQLDFRGGKRETSIERQHEQAGAKRLRKS